MLTMLISGPKQPGYDINTYLAPLIDDLKILWEEGVQCFDAYKEEYFCEPSYCGLSMISLYTVIYVGVVSKVLRLVQYVEKRLLQSDYNMEKKMYTWDTGNICQDIILIDYRKRILMVSKSMESLHNPCQERPSTLNSKK